MEDQKTKQTGQTDGSAANSLVVGQSAASTPDELKPVLIVPDGHKSAQQPAASSQPVSSQAVPKTDSVQSQTAVFTPVPTEQPAHTQHTQPVLLASGSQTSLSPRRATTVKSASSAANSQSQTADSVQPTSQVAKELKIPVAAPPKNQVIKELKNQPAALISATPATPTATARPTVVAAVRPKLTFPKPIARTVSRITKPTPSTPVTSAISVTAPVPSTAAATSAAAPTSSISTPPESAPPKQNFFSKLFKRKPPTEAETAKVAEHQSAVAQIHAAEELYKNGLASIKDLIAPSSLEIHYNYLNLSGVFVRSFFIYSYPRYLDTNWLSPIINFDATFEFSQFIYPISSEEIMKILRKKVAQIQSSITIDQERGNVRDPAMATALEDAEQLRTEIQRGQEKFFQFGMYFTVYADDEKKLDTVTKQFEGMLGGKLILTKRADIQGEHAFNSTLPLCLDELEVHRNMNTSPLSTTFPFISSDLTSDEGILYGLNRHNDSLVIFDRFKLPNANSVVFASSGAGKSYAVKLEILRMMMLGTDMIVIDPENEYESITNAVGGSYLRVSLNAEQRINPFDLPQAFDDQDLHPGDLLRSNVITLTGLLKLMLGKLTDTEEALLEKALFETYAIKGITMDTERPGDVAPPTMEDFHSVLTGLTGAESIAQRLQKYTTGTFAGIFNKPTNINLDNSLVTFCIRDLEDQLRPVAMYILLNYIWNRVRSKLKRRVLVLDEAWTMMQYEDAAKFLYGLVKRARKYYLGITAITQDVEDFLSSPYGRPVVTNSSMQMLFKQSPSSMEMLKKTFNLTDGEKYLLLNSSVGQGLFFAGRKHVAIQVIASYSEHQLVTTDPEEILAQKAKAAEGFGK